MSDTSEENPQSDRQPEENVCRDYVRGTCERKFCKYRHEPDAKMLNFCHDYQNSVCPRPHCKFIHCSPEEVDEYKRTGEMSNQILAEATRKNQIPGTPPICNQFKKGLCRRNFCKFRHVTREQEEVEILDLIQNNMQRRSHNGGVGNNNISEGQITIVNGLNGVHRRAAAGITLEEYTELGLLPSKRRFLTTQDDLDINTLEQARLRPLGFKGYFSGTPPPAIISRADARTIMLEEENTILHKEIAQLKRQVSDLTATNEFLLDQNAALRLNGVKRVSAAAATAAVSVPTAVAITNSNAATAAAAQQTTQQQVIRTVTASVGAVPVSLATVSTCNPVPVNSVSIAACPTVSIASPAQLLASSPQILVTTNPPTQLAIANSSQAQQLAIAANTSQAQQLAMAANANQAQQLAMAQQSLNNLAQQAAQPQLTSQAQQLALATTTQQLTSQAQHIALATTPQQAQQLATLAANGQQLAMAATGAPQAALAAVANVSQQLQNMATAAANQQQIEQLHRAATQIGAINTSQTIAMSNASQPLVSYPIMTQSINHALTH